MKNFTSCYVVTFNRTPILKHEKEKNFTQFTSGKQLYLINCATFINVVVAVVVAVAVAGAGAAAAVVVVVVVAVVVVVVVVVVAVVKALHTKEQQEHTI